MSGHPTIIRVMILLLLMIGWLGAGFYLGQRHANDCMVWTPGPASDARSGERSIVPLASPSTVIVVDTSTYCRIENGNPVCWTKP